MPLLMFLKGEHEHRRVKRFYPTTNKINHADGIAKRQHREKLLFNMGQQRLNSATPIRRNRIGGHSINNGEALPFMAPDKHHHISTSTKQYDDVYRWVAERSEDPAYEVL